MGSRNVVESRAREILESSVNSSIIIDRCNFDSRQRKHWVHIATEVQTRRDQYRIHKIVVVMPKAVNLSFCVEKATLRGVDNSHPNVENWEMICRSILKEFKMPNKNEEKYDAYYYCENDHDLEVLQRLLHQSEPK